jgi:hypothetical protein
LAFSLERIAKTIGCQRQLDVRLVAVADGGEFHGGKSAGDSASSHAGGCLLAKPTSAFSHETTPCFFGWNDEGEGRQIQDRGL